MALFQNSILNAYKQDEALIAPRWAAYQNFLAKKDAVKEFKEEEYQEGFLKDVFASCLGYTLKTSDPANFNLERETKNETDSKKADGAIYVGGKVTGVIELKAQNTQNLDKATDQAFGYLTKNSHAKYVIVSNFDELRFYVEKATDYEKFHLFSLDYDGFKKLHLILSYESIAKELPHAMKQKSQNFEQEISKQLYKDFSAFRTHLFENIVKNNFTCHAKTLNQVQGDRLGYSDASSRHSDSPLRHSDSPLRHSDSPLRHSALDAESKETLNQVQGDVGDDAKSTPNLDKTALLRLTQKLCDRIIFILFAEDRGLLNPNTIKEIRSRHADDIMGNPMYGYYKIYFNAINQGNEKLAIPKYNGGLFAPDALLESLVIDDEALDMQAQKLSDYDFASDISVNILGHIFEQSLTDLEELQANIEHTEFDKKQGKRKKDGVFYTPEYITRYIVQNTLGTLCDEKKEKLSLADEAFASPINPKKLTKEQEKHKQNILEYRAWLENLKILDPACGSGAFLNQALEFLIAEHTQVRDWLLPFQDLTLNYEIETAILEHNLYGVDINEDAVEIARLSLWLRTARRGRTLTNLSGKIKCGNSLIDDKTVAENAFVWEEEFPEVFAQGGFDVVIGNPPYLGGREWKNKDIEKYFISKYKVAEYQFDMYILFMELGVNLVKANGLFSYITPNTWLNNQKNTKLRAFILNNTAILSIVDYSQIEVFSDATVLTAIATFKKASSLNDVIIFKPFNNQLLQSGQLNQQIWLQNDYHIMNIDLSNTDNLLLKKIESLSSPLESIAKIKFGVKLYETGKGEPRQEAFFAKEKIYESNSKLDNSYQKYITGKDIERYNYFWDNTWVKYGKNLAAPREAELFKGNKIVVRRIVGDTLIATSIQEDLITSQLLQIVKLHDENLTNTITALLNSKLMIYFFRKKYNRQEKTFPEIRIYELASLPIPKNIQIQNELDIKVVLLIKSIQQLQQTKQNFLNELGLEKLPKKLQNFEELEFEEFVKEYAKAKKIKFADKLAERNFKQEWQAMFEHDKTMACNLKEQIEQTDKAIDAMVYKLYDLTDEEIKIVEGNH